MRADTTLAYAEKAKPLLWSARCHIQFANYCLYYSLALAAVYGSQAGERQAEIRSELAANMQALERWAQSCPVTFGHKHLLVCGELARLGGREMEAIRFYERAARSAGEHGFVQDQALANEWAGRCCLASGLERPAHAYLREARDCYFRWGALGKVAQLDRRYPAIKPAASPVLRATIEKSIDQLDIATVVKTAQAISGEMVLENLIKSLMVIAVEHAGAERGVLMLPRGTERRIEAEATIAGNTVVVRLPGQKLTAALPESIVSYVVSTGESVILDDASADNPFSADPYFGQKHTRSVLCLPLLKPAKLVGVLYLENNLTPHVFTADRISLLNVLASQAAISLENTRLYRELEQREAKIRRLVDANIIGIVIFDIEGRIIEANDAFLHTVGYNREDLASGRLRWTDLTPPEWLDIDERERVPELKMTGVLPPFEKEYLRKDGSRVPVLLGVAMFEGSGDEGVTFVLDISERKRAERALRDSEELKRRIIESTMDGIKVLDLDGNLLFMSSSGQNLLEIDDIQSYLNTSWTDLWQPEDRPKVSEAVAAARAGGIGRFQAFRPSAKGAPRWWDVITTPIFNADGQPEQLLAASRDITEHILAEAEARESERRYREAQMALTRANRVATIGQLTASIAHEVNQPIAAARNNAASALRFLSRNPPDLEEVREALECIVNDTDRAGDIVDRIRVHVRKEHPRNACFDINDAINELIGLTRSDMVEKGVTIRIRLTEGLCPVQGDRVQLQQVVLNLILNAVEAMSSVDGGPLELSISTEPRGVDEVLVAVRDSGPGIDPEHLERVFDSFYTTKPGGMGLGLSICRSIVEAHQGRLWADASEHRGAVFQFTLPAANKDS